MITWEVPVGVTETDAVPLEAAVEILHVNEDAEVSTSVTCRVSVPEVSSVTVNVCGLDSVKTGASLTGVMVTLTVIVSVRLPSETCTTKLSAVLEFRVGVYVITCEAPVGVPETAAEP